MFSPNSIDEVVGNAAAIQELTAALSSTNHIHLYGPYGVGKRTILRLLLPERQEHFCSLLRFHEVLELFDSKPPLVPIPIVLYDTDVLNMSEKTQLLKAIHKKTVVTVGKYGIDADIGIKFQALTAHDIGEVLAYVCVEHGAWAYLDQLQLSRKTPSSIAAGVQEICNQSDETDIFSARPTMLHTHVFLKSPHWELCVELLSAVTQSQDYDAPSDMECTSTAMYFNQQAVVARRQSVLKSHCRRLNCSALDFVLIQRLLMEMAFANLLEENMQDVSFRRALSYRQPRSIADRLRRRLS